MADKKIWHNSLPVKNSFFMANLWRDRIPIDPVVRKLNVSGPSMCDCCFNAEEETNHLFSSGSRAKEVWKYFENSLGMLQTPKELRPKCIYWWTGNRKNKIWSFILQMLPSTICWFFWKARNKWRFENTKSSSTQIIANISSFFCDMFQVAHSNSKLHIHSWTHLTTMIEDCKWKVTSLPIYWNANPLRLTLNVDGCSSLDGHGYSRWYPPEPPWPSADGLFCLSGIRKQKLCF